MIISFSSNPIEEVMMNEIVHKEVLAEKIKKIEVRAPEIAAKALPGQFVVLRINEQGERDTPHGCSKRITSMEQLT